MKNLLPRIKLVLSRLVFYRTEEEVNFSFGWFIAFVLMQTVVFMTLVYTFCYFAHRDYIPVQLHAAWWAYLACFLVARLIMSLFEYLFHRYALHRIAFRWLATFKECHTEHHSLTMALQARYPITAADQIESSSFPGYALVSFWGVFSLIIIPAQIVLPGLPVLITGYLAVVFSFSLYEIVHAIEHLDYEQYWKKWTDRSKRIRKIYGFHLIHHWHHSYNQAVGGFAGIALWDWVFRTRYVPDKLPLEVLEEPWRPVDPLPKPRWPISALDRLVMRRHQRLTAQLKIRP